MILQDTLYKVHSTGLFGTTDLKVEGLSLDSRQVSKDFMYVAIKGTHVDGHQFIDQAINLGAKAIICEKMPPTYREGVTYVKVEDSAEACGMIASNFYGNPSSELKLVGVTGTNGKTTVATLLFKLFRSLGYSCALLSTVQNQIDEEVIPAILTTPDAISIHSFLAKAVTAGCDYAFMEASSIAIHQKRTAGLEFDGGIFTNITHDHLDYHKTFDEYLRVKKSFFDNLSSSAFAMTNLDDKRGMVMLQNTKAKKCSYGLRNPSDYKGKILENDLAGLVMMIDKEEVHFRLTGRFNAYNLLAVYGSARELGEEHTEVLEKLSGLTGAEGRFDLIISPHSHVKGIIDYAHTPDALMNVLSTINELRNGKEKLITVVGCGGDRDKTKRPEMAQVAVQYSDKTIFTSDNPRTEDPDAIIRDMEAGVPSGMSDKYLSISDRKEAIKVACSFSGAGDIVLIAGKGHEKYQETNHEKKPFDDKVVLTEMFALLQK